MMRIRVAVQHVLAVATAFVLATPLLAAAEPLCVEVPVANDRCPAWTAVHDATDAEGNTGREEAVAVATSGGRVFVAGGTEVGAPVIEIQALAAETGQELWTARVGGALSGLSGGLALAAAPDGSRLFLMATSTAADFLVVSLDPATGAIQWTTTYDGSAGGPDHARDLAVSPDSNELYVTGWSEPPGERQALVLLALSASDGAQLWTMRYRGPTRYYAARDSGHAVSVSPDGGRVFVAGRSTGSSRLEGTNFDLVTLAVDVPDQDQQPSAGWAWVGRFTVAVNVGVSGRVGLGVSEDGTRVVMSGEGDNNFWTVGYDATGGEELWSAELHGTPISQGWVSTLDEAKVEISEGRAFVAISKAWDPGPLVASYDVDTGAEQWTARYLAGPPLGTSGMVLAPDGDTVYTLASSLDAGYGSSAAAFDAETGSQLWVGRMNSANEHIYGNALAISSSGDALLATGGISEPEVDGQDVSWTGDFLTWSYPL